MGKSTMIKMIVGDESGEGELNTGHNVEVGYYAQIQEKTLNPDDTVEMVIENEATGDNAKIHRVRALLGAFLFGPEDYNKKVKVLSGGEKSRLALAKLLLRECNLLILDEPTNHLDMSAKEVLKKALIEYNGSLIVVSHDREFLQGLTDRTFEFKDGNVKEHIGTIDDFLSGYQIRSFREFEKAGEQVKQEKKEAAKKVEADSTGLSNKVKRDKEKELKQLKANLRSIEKKIEQQESDIAALEQKMSDPSEMQKPENKSLFHDHADMQRKLDEYMLRWEKAGAEIDVLTEMLAT